MDQESAQILRDSNCLLGNQLQLGDGFRSWLTFRESPISVAHAEKDTILSNVARNASSSLLFAPRLESPLRQAHMCVSCHRGVGGYTESLPEIAFQSLGLVRGGVS